MDNKRDIALVKSLFEMSAKFDDPIIYAVANLIRDGMPIETAIIEGFKALAACNKELKSLLVKTHEWGYPHIIEDP